MVNIHVGLAFHQETSMNMGGKKINGNDSNGVKMRETAKLEHILSLS